MKHVFLRKTMLARRIACAALALCLMLPTQLAVLPVSASTISSKQSELSKLQAEEKKLKATISSAGSDLAQQQNVISALKKQIANVQKQLDLYAEEINALNKEIRAQSGEINKMNAQIKEKETYMADLLAKLKSRVCAISKTGNMTTLQMIVDTNEYTDYLLKSQVLKLVSQHDQALMDEAEKEKEAIEATKKTVESKQTATLADKKQVQALQSQQDAKRADLSTLCATAASKEASLKKNLNTYKAQQAVLQKQEAELERQIEALAAGPTVNTKNYDGTMKWPVPTVHTISSGFGMRWGKLHGGIDISNGRAYGAKIVAAADGVVIRVASHSSYGNYCMIDHGNDSKGRRIVTLYAHMATSAYVRVGQKVTAGVTQIGIVGSTGNSTGPHLHFEVRVNGTRVNPVSNGYVRA